MVKVDVNRNYYAELELTPAATAEEVKKHFKKLGRISLDITSLKVYIETNSTTLQALKYHPDRNLGNEAEFNARFQAIQSAHEVLSDQQQRAKYDAERIRAGLYTMRSTPTRPNMPPRAPNTNFPPPPPRPPPRPANKSSYPTTPPRGANRYSNYARAEGAKWTSAKEDAQDRTNRFKAWERLSHGQKPNRYPVPPEPPKASNNFPYQTGREESNYMPKEPPPKMRPGWEKFQQANAAGPKLNRASTTRTPMKPGFAPGTVGGDEPAARNASAYFHLNKGGRPNATGAQPPFESPPGGSPQHLRKPDPLGRFKSQSGDEDHSRSGADRMSTPYATSGGERTYFSSSGLGRSASTREPQTGRDWNAPPPASYRSPGSQASSERHQSASPKMRSSGHRHRSTSVSSTSSSDSVREGDEAAFHASSRKANGAQPSPAPDAHTRTRRRRQYQPYVYADRNDANDAGDASPDFTPDIANPKRNAWHQQNEAKRNTFPSNDDTHRSDAHTQNPQEREAYRTRQQQPQPPTEFAPGSSAWQQQDPQHPLRKAGSWQEKYQPKPSVNGPGFGENAEKPTMYEIPGLSPSLLPLSHKRTAAWPSMSQSQEKLQSAPTITPYWAIPSSVWPKKLKAVPIDFLDPPQWKANTTQPAIHKANQWSNTSFTFAPEKQPFSDIPSLSKDFKSHSSENINTTFSPTDWSGKFTGNATEYFAPVAGQADYATRGKASPGRGRPTSRTPFQEHHNQPPVSDQGTGQGDSPQVPSQNGAPPPPSAGQAKFSSDEWAQIFKERKWAFPPPPPPLSPSRQTNFKRPKSPRKQSRSTNKRPPIPKPPSVRVIVDDSGKEAAAKDRVSNAESISNQTNVDGTPMEIDENLTPPMANKPSSNPTETTPKQPSHHAPGLSVPPDDSSTRAYQQDASNLNLGNLKKVSPFVPGNEGLKDLGDLSNTLPFESRPASSTHSLAPQRLALPNPPKAPDIPERLTQNAWERYLAQMRGYMFEWNGYNKKMLGHFSDRQRDVEDGLAPEWMSAVGEGSGDKGGYGKLMQGIEEDFRVRAHWDVSWEKHRECLRGLGKLRDRLLKTTKVV